MDKRSEYTRKAIKSAFLELMKQTDYAHISVAEICRAAKINRSTFYLHYHKADDVLNDVLDDTIQEIDSVFEQFKPSGDICNRAFCQFVRGNSQYQPLFLDDGITDYIIGRLARHYVEDYAQRICKMTSLSPGEAKQIYYFQLHGCLSVIKHNLTRDEETWSDIKCTIDRFIQRGLFGKI